MDNPTVDQLVVRVRAQRGEWKRLADEAKVSYSWLAKFGQGHVSNPTLGAIQRLAAALDAREAA